jgi:hypothetical protein
MACVEKTDRLFQRALMIGTCLLIAATAMAQGPGNPQGPPVARGLVQSGYAVITPASGSTAGLVVFETFGERHGNDTTQAGVLPSAMTTHAMLFVSTNGRLSRNIGVAIANPGATEADVTLTLRDDTGTTLASLSPIKVAARTQITRFVTELFAAQPTVPKDMTGTMDISSNTPVAVIGVRFRGINFSTMPTTNISAPLPVPVISSGVGGPDAVILPQFATGGGWATEIILANTGTSALTVRVDLFGQDGLPLVATLNGQTGSSFANITIPAGGVIVLESEGNDDF